MIVRELTTTLDFDLKDEKLKEFEKRIVDAKAKINTFKTNLLTAIGTVTALGGGLLGLALNTAKTIKSTELLANQVGVSSTVLQELELAAQRSGLKVDELSNSFSIFNKIVGSAKLSTKGTISEFETLGISLRDNKGNLKSTSILYQQAAEKINSLSDKSKKAALSQRLFGTSSAELTMFMGQSTEALAKQRQEVKDLSYIVDEKGIKTNNEFLKSWTDFKLILDGVKKEISISFMPVFNELIDGFKVWFKINKTIISQKLKSFVSLLTIVFKTLYNAIDILLTPIRAMINFFGGLENTVRILGVAFVASLIPAIFSAVSAFKVLTTALLTNPFIAIGVAIGAIVDDIWNWVEGNESLIESILGPWSEAGPKLQAIWANMLSGFNDTLAAIGNFGQEIFDALISRVMKLIELFNKIRSFTIFRDNEGESKNVKPIKLSEYRRQGGMLRLTKQAEKDKEEADIEVARKDTADYIKSLRQTAAYQDSLDERNNDVNFEPYNLKELIANKINAPIQPNNDMAANKVTNKTTNKILQNINENITVNVPAGTTEEQARVITQQVASAMENQFNTEILRGLDALPQR